MDLRKLDSKKMEYFLKKVDYHKGIETSNLYDSLKNLKYSVEDKVKFILWHWGWTGEERVYSTCLIDKIQEMGFCIPQIAKTIYQQLWLLKIPVKNIFQQGGENFVDYGGTIIFSVNELLWKSMIVHAELLGTKFRETVLPLGIRRNYNGYIRNSSNGWEDPNYDTKGWGLDELYIGDSGKVIGIIDVEYGGYIEVQSENIIDFFAASFGFIQEKICEMGELDNESLTIETIESLMATGKYQQNCLWVKK